MIPELHQSIEEILKAASPEELILWSQTRLIVGETAALRALHYVGNLVNSEFNIAGVQRRIYIAYNLNIGFTTGSGASDAPVTIVTPTGNMVLRNQGLTFNSVAAQIQYSYNTINFNNILFTSISELFGGAVVKISFTGYRIIY